jgi:CopG family transcriptional regulator, nickel-responsive regulator
MLVANHGRSSEVKAFADHVIAERGVRHGHVVFMLTDSALGRPVGIFAG